MLVRDFGRLSLPSLRHLDLRAVAPNAVFSVDASLLPRGLVHLGLQNAVLIYDQTTAVRTMWLILPADLTAILGLNSKSGRYSTI